jgi:hypothetical protein
MTAAPAAREQVDVASLQDRKTRGTGRHPVHRQP